MNISYFVVDKLSEQKIPAKIRPATQKDFQITKTDNWQSNWTSEFMRQSPSDKFALEISETHELVGLGAYQKIAESVIVYIEYIESAPNSNPTITHSPRYSGIGAALLAYGVQLSVDYGYGGAIFLKAKTSDLRRHYIDVYGATPFSHIHPELLLIDGGAALNLLSQFFEETEDM